MQLHWSRWVQNHLSSINQCSNHHGNHIVMSQTHLHVYLQWSRWVCPSWVTSEEVTVHHTSCVLAVPANVLGNGASEGYFGLYHNICYDIFY